MVAVNLHLQFLVSVIGGLPSVPTVELAGAAPKSTLPGASIASPEQASGARGISWNPLKSSPSIRVPAGLIPGVPPLGSGLRWAEFVRAVAVSCHAPLPVAAVDLAAAHLFIPIAARDMILTLYAGPPPECSNRTGFALRVQLHVTRPLVPARTG